uniref:Cytochrome b5 heme-binding domain-containing protein n=1 Tax=Amphora coffeiformis TaxID=265554 RepID=A0A7S3LGK6_9STRA|mmetsp:Transcript_4002/g.8000  ORF Transcript_4002/g.8000 Transcript_4002/m.8000 type:complete len:187 (-) Transcript_4002:92-652(-)
MYTTTTTTGPTSTGRRRRFASERKMHECEDCCLPDGASDDSSLVGSGPCEACPYCSDTCGDDSCKLCVNKTCLEISTPTCPPRSASLPVFTLCQVRKHCTEKSVWIVAGKDIYDVTAYIDRHPGGRECILRKAGGARDCTDDFQFHSKAGRRGWNKYKVGVLVPCPGHASHQDEQEKPWWQFWGNE